MKGIATNDPRLQAALQKNQIKPGWWQDIYPQTTPSLPWEPLYRLGNTHVDGITDYETWENTRYSCSVRRFKNGFFIRNRPYIVIGISHAHGSAGHDWRDFQAIKNDICGKEWEGIELYPAESRLKETSNCFYIWCVEKGVLKFGLPGGRLIYTPDQALAPQRPFPTPQK